MIIKYYSALALIESQFLIALRFSVEDTKFCDKYTGVLELSETELY
jgi:hypothetical protein